MTHTALEILSDGEWLHFRALRSERELQQAEALVRLSPAYRITKHTR